MVATHLLQNNAASQSFKNPWRKNNGARPFVTGSWHKHNDARPFFNNALQTWDVVRPVRFPCVLVGDLLRYSNYRGLV